MIQLSNLKQSLLVLSLIPVLWSAERFIASGLRFYQWQTEGVPLALGVGIGLALLFFVPLWQGSLWIRDWFGIITRGWGVFSLVIAWMDSSSSRALMGVVWLAYSGIGQFMIRKETEVTYVDPKASWYVGKLKAKTGIQVQLHDQQKVIPVSLVRFDEMGLMVSGVPRGIKLGQRLRLTIESWGQKAEFFGTVVRCVDRLNAVGLRSSFDQADQYKTYLDCVERVRAHG